jgi:hypothetical protein
MIVLFTKNVFVVSHALINGVSPWNIATTYTVYKYTRKACLTLQATLLNKHGISEFVIIIIIIIIVSTYISFFSRKPFS